MPDAKTQRKVYLRQLRAARVAQKQLEQRMERIRWEEVELLPELEAEKVATAIPGADIPTLEIEVGDDADSQAQ